MATTVDFAELRQALGADKLRLAEPLAKHTSFKIGGPAQAMAFAHDGKDLQACLGFAKAHGLPVTLLAGGTNVLVKDGGIRGLVVSLEGEFKEFSIAGTQLRAGTGINLALLARKASLAGLKGLEWAIGIPGSLGGGLVMNAGAHGGEIKDVVQRVGTLEDGVFKTVAAADCGFVYRSSRFKHSGILLLWAEMQLREAPVEELKAAMEHALESRKASQPLELPNAGCVFKNPEGQSAGRLIDEAGLKGLRLGGAQISEKHANFVVNTGEAKASDVLGLMAQARLAVKEKFGVDLTDEVLVLGEDA
jgi:UDP-N-acetylmuramate dehydrogenase